MPETPAVFPMEKSPCGFQCLICGLAWASRREFFQDVVDISVKQSKKTAEGFRWFGFGPPQLRQAGHRGGEEGMEEVWVVVPKHWSWRLNVP